MANKQAYPAFILDELLKGNIKYKEVFEVFLSKFKCSEPTFSKYWKIAQIEYNKHVLESEKVISKQVIQQQKENVSNGLKSKFERLIILQTQVQSILDRIEKNAEIDIMFIEGRLQKIPREMTVNEMMMCKRTLRELQSEISKIEGDYAPTKQDHTSNGKELRTIQVEIINANTSK